MTQLFFHSRSVCPLIFWGFLGILEIAILAGMPHLNFTQSVFAQSASRVPLPPSQRYTQLTQQISERENATAFVISPVAPTTQNSSTISPPTISLTEAAPKTPSSPKTPIARFEMVEPPKKGENRVLVTGVIDSAETPKTVVANLPPKTAQNFSTEKTPPLTWSSAPVVAEKIASQNSSKNSAAANGAKNSRAIPARNGATLSFAPATQSTAREVLPRETTQKTEIKAATKIVARRTTEREESLRNDSSSPRNETAWMAPPPKTSTREKVARNDKNEITPLDFSALKMPKVSEIASPVLENPIVVIAAENKNVPEAVAAKENLPEMKIAELQKTEKFAAAAEKNVIPEIIIQEVAKSETKTAPAPIVSSPEEKVVAKQLRRAPLPTDGTEEAGMSRSTLFTAKNEDDDEEAAGFSKSGALK